MVSRTFYTFWQRYWCIPVYIVLAAFIVYAVRHIQPLYIGYIPRYLRVVADLAFFLVALVVAINIVQKLSLPLYGRWLREKFPESDVIVETTKEGIVMAYGETRWLVGYADVRQIMVSKTLIGFIVGASVIHLPLRAFGSISDAHAMIRDVFAKISESARRQSLKQRDLREIISASPGAAGEPERS